MQNIFALSTNSSSVCPKTWIISILLAPWWHVRLTIVKKVQFNKVYIVIHIFHQTLKAVHTVSICQQVYTPYWPFSNPRSLKKCAHQSFPNGKFAMKLKKKNVLKCSKCMESTLISIDLHTPPPQCVCLYIHSSVDNNGCPFCWN